MDTHDDPRLPELRTAELDATTLDALLADLAEHTRILGIRLKGAPEELAKAAEPRLDGLRDLLLGGAVRGAQIRYHYDGGDWCDTLIATVSGVRLVRMRLEPEEN